MSISHPHILPPKNLSKEVSWLKHILSIFEKFGLSISNSSKYNLLYLSLFIFSLFIFDLKKTKTPSSELNTLIPTLLKFF